MDPVEIDVEVPLSFRTIVGPGVTLLGLPLAIGGAHLYIAYHYSYFFQDISRGVLREGIWPFFVLPVLCVLLVGYCLLRWRTYIEEEENCWSRVTGVVSMNGPFFLWKLYLLELAQVVAQTYNLSVIYTCTLPTALVSITCILLVCDKAFATYSMFQPHTPARRDRQVKIDFAVDLACLLLPLTFIWFGYRIPVGINDMLLLTVWPTLSALMKIEELFEESIKQNYANIMVKSEERRSFKMNRRRSSLFQQPVILRQAEEQAKRMPKRARLFFAGIWSLTATFYLTVGVLQLSATVKCHPLLWEHCKVQVPFCRSLFTPRCNCAVLSIEGHNMTRLPLEIEDMTGLRLVTVSKGPLVEIPRLAKMTKLSQMNFQKNHLEDITRVQEAKALTVLDVTMNRIKSLPELNGLKDLFTLYASYNRIEHIPKGLNSALRYVKLSNNRLTRIPKDVWLNIELLAVGHNNLTLPEGIYAPSLTTLGLPSNNITVLPKWNAPLLYSLDVRNNRLKQLPKLDLQYLWAAGNPLCESESLTRFTEQGMGCTKQCARTCLDIWKGDGECDVGCDNLKCKFDGGDCK